MSNNKFDHIDSAPEDLTSNKIFYHRLRDRISSITYFDEDYIQQRLLQLLREVTIQRLPDSESSFSSRKNKIPDVFKNAQDVRNEILKSFNFLNSASNSNIFTSPLTIHTFYQLAKSMKTKQCSDILLLILLRLFYPIYYVKLESSIGFLKNCIKTPTINSESLETLVYEKCEYITDYFSNQFLKVLEHKLSATKSLTREPNTHYITFVRSLNEVLYPLYKLHDTEKNFPIDIISFLLHKESEITEDEEQFRSNLYFYFCNECYFSESFFSSNDPKYYKPRLDYSKYFETEQQQF